jgi:glutathionylspermidine synthase
MYGEPYWDEDSVYEFDLAEVEQEIEDPATELHAMCLDAVDHIVRSEELMTRLEIPTPHWDMIANSWAARTPELYGRFDFIYDGTGAAKMLEYNGDTPTSLYESASFQWQWLEDMIQQGRLPEGSDQFNGIYEALQKRFAEMFEQNTPIHFAAFEDSLEDYSTTEIIGWAARDAGMHVEFTDIRKIGITEQGQFADDESRVIGNLFKLYPWEDLLRDDFAPYIADSECNFIEPAWKAIVSNKGILPVLWKLNPGHRNLLPAFFKDEFDAGGDAVLAARDLMSKGTVTKPIFSREGASITIETNEGVLEQAEDRTYDDHPMIVQAYKSLPTFDGFRPVIGAWMVGKECAGMGIREDRSRITQDMSRFKPHYIRG